MLTGSLKTLLFNFLLLKLFPSLGKFFEFFNIFIIQVFFLEKNFRGFSVFS